MMPSRGSQVPGWQRWIPKPVILAQTTGSDSGVSKTVNFMVPVPDSRLRVKVSLLFKRLPGSGGATQTPPTTLWLYEADQEDAGFDGEDLPLTDLEGTSTAPLAIPDGSPLLSGYSREFITAADYINGRMVVTNNGVSGYWILQTRYQPQTTPFSLGEWEIVRAQCTPSGGGNVIVT
jgi:hypothetical protein